jgi:hypothetical protein
MTVDAATAGALARGQMATPPGDADGSVDGAILVVDGDGRLIAIATLVDGRLAPDKVLVDLADVAAPVQG